MPAPFDKPVKLWAQVTNTCNLDCVLCYGDCSDARRDEELSTAEWLEFIDHLVEEDFFQIYFEGGELLARPDFMTILEHCSRRLLTWMRTNGTLITADVARQLRELGVGAVCVDLWAANEKTHDELVGVPGSHARTVQGIRHLVAEGIPTVMCIILMRPNVGELQEYLELAHELGVGRVGVLRLYPIGRAKRKWPELALSLDEMTAALHGMKPPQDVYVMQSWHPRDGNCCWENSGVDAYGRSIGCPYLREYVDYGNIRQVPFLETWKHPLYVQLRESEIEGSCTQCDDAEGTGGGCRSSAYAFTGRWDAPDPFCSEQNKGVDLRVLPRRLLDEAPQPAGQTHGPDGGPAGLHP
ncbi:MAG TPA: radical SAM protein [Actinocrinis sp.]|uniref:radical SAM protein n=1 Tax=Actinocrinis sp. TaxID=1920516 RepID=UPI002DDD0FDD|nr:radical SAM protein [Actinocrinis sp.]HEV2344911.1 radical SAM protein [Actinocrinis sp.]